MNQSYYSLGLDVDKSSFKACLKVKDETQRISVKAARTFSNNVKGFDELIQWTKKFFKSIDGNLKVVMEATGVYHEHLAWHMFEKDLNVHIVLPLRARRFMQSIGLKSKNDKIDAQGLADMGLQQELIPWKPGSKNLLKLRSLTRQLEMFQETRTIFNNQLEAAIHLANCDKMVIQNLNKMIKTMDANIKKIKITIHKLVLQDEPLAAKFKLVEPIKGVGMITFATIVAETGGFELFESQKQLVSYVGYDVIENQSGMYHGKTRISKKGNTHIRRILFMSAFNMVTYNVDPLCELYERVYDRTKIKMKAYVAVQRKLLCLIFALWKNDSTFDPAYTKKTSGIHEPKSLFSVDPKGSEAKVAIGKPMATLDELPCIQSPEALFSVNKFTK